MRAEPKWPRPALPDRLAGSIVYLHVAPNQWPFGHVACRCLNLEPVRHRCRRRSRLSAVVDVDCEVDCRPVLVGHAHKLRVLASGTRRAWAGDHETADGRGLYADISAMVVVFQIPLGGAARHGEAEGCLPAHAG